MVARPPAREILTDPVHLLAFGFGTGLAPYAPGTFGTLPGVAIALALHPFGPVVMGVALVLTFLVGVWICGESARRLGTHDHPGIVWDEITGFLLVAVVIPSGWPWWVAAFVLFRLFDIVKPWPIRDLDHSLGGGLGIMLDDVLAGLFAAVCIVLLGQAF